MTSPKIRSRFNFQQTAYSLDKKNIIDRARTRLFMMSLVFGFIIISMIWRLLDLTVIRQEGSEIAGLDSFAKDQLTTGRADVVDRHGQLMATTIVTSSLFANPKKILNAELAAKKIAKTFSNLTEAEVLKKLTSDKTFIWLQRHLTPAQQAKVLELGLPGIEFMRDYRRVYPQNHLASHVIGFTDIDNQGLAGIEKGQDELLRINNQALELSLDLRFQHIVRDELTAAIREFSCIGASGIIMDYKTGEILAMVSLPDFNPNKPLKFSDDDRFNKTTLGIYELGSILKIVNTALGLETGAVTLDTRFNTAEAIKVGRFTITDYKVPPGLYNVAEIFIKSSNRGSIRIALAAGIEKQKAFFRKLGFMDTLKLEIPEVGQPSIPKHWREATTMTASYGYGFSISPLQILTGIATIVGGGQQIYPTLLKHTSPESQTNENCNQVISKVTSKKVLQLMRRVVLEGTARRAAIPGYFVAGKTGTVNLLQHGGYNKQSVATSFISIWGECEKNPRYIMITRLYDPKRVAKTFNLNSAGWNTVPAARNIMERVIHITGMEPREPVIVPSSIQTLQTATPKVQRVHQ